MWARVQKVTKRGKRKWKMAELFADERSEEILEFLRTTDVNRKVPTEKAKEAGNSESGRNRSARGASACADFF